MYFKLLTGLLIIMFPAGLLIMLTDFGKQYLWTTTIFLGLQAIILFMLLFRFWGAVLALVPSSIIFVLSFIIELIGVNTGYPFGNYSYSDILTPQVFGVPAAIAFAWFGVTVSSYLIVINKYNKAGAFTAALISSVLIFAIDVLLEPFASFVNGFWSWESGRIPFQNFIVWLVLGYLFSLVLSLFIRHENSRDTEPYIKKIPYIVFILNSITFLIINIYNGYIFMSILGLIIISFILFILPVTAKNEV